MPIFNGIPPSSRNNKIVRFEGETIPSVMCADCQAKFKDFLKHGGIRPKACDICSEKLKNKMFTSRYPDRS